MGDGTSSGCESIMFPLLARSQQGAVVCVGNLVERVHWQALRARSTQMGRRVHMRRGCGDTHSVLGIIVKWMSQTMLECCQERNQNQWSPVLQEQIAQL